MVVVLLMRVSLVFERSSTVTPETPEPPCNVTVPLIEMALRARTIEMLLFGVAVEMTVDWSWWPTAVVVSVHVTFAGSARLQLPSAIVTVLNVLVFLPTTPVAFTAAPARTMSLPLWNCECTIPAVAFEAFESVIVVVAGVEPAATVAEAVVSPCGATTPGDEVYEALPAFVVVSV